MSKSSIATLLELGPPHVWWLFACIEKSFEHFIGLVDIDRVNANPFIMFD